MSKQVLWNKPLLDEFCRLAMLSDEERTIMEGRLKGESIVCMSMKYSMSESKINKMIARLKIKYDSVQPYSAILPERKKSAKEVYMDTH